MVHEASKSAQPSPVDRSTTRRALKVYRALPARDQMLELQGHLNQFAAPQVRDRVLQRSLCPVVRGIGSKEVSEVLRGLGLQASASYTFGVQ